MKINNLGLKAFHQVSLRLNMTLAAEELGLTQSALSQRISALEDDLETTLFVREGRSLSLTSAGIELLKYTKAQENLEDELLSKLRGDSKEIAGSLRIGSYSSILRSILLPKLAPFLRNHAQVLVEFKSYETNELYDVLRSGQADFVFSDYRLSKKGIIEKVFDEEEYVVIESSKFKGIKDVYLDHDVNDQMTEIFFEKQLSVPKYRRSFMGDVYGIIDAVELGLGRAVMSKHLIEGNKNIQIVKGFKPFKREIILHYYESALLFRAY